MQDYSSFADTKEISINKFMKRRLFFKVSSYA